MPLLSQMSLLAFISIILFKKITLMASPILIKSYPFPGLARSESLWRRSEEDEQWGSSDPSVSAGWWSWLRLKPELASLEALIKIIKSFEICGF